MNGVGLIAVAAISMALFAAYDNIPSVATITDYCCVLP